MLDPILLSILCLTSFLLASGLLLGGFQSSAIAVHATRWGHLIFCLGTLALTATAIQSLILSNGADNEHLNALFFATAIAWMSIIAWFVWRMHLIGAFTAPVIALTLLLDIFFGNQHQASSSLDAAGPLLAIHVASAIIGQTFAIAACGASLMLLWQQRKLKQRQLQSLPLSFPALDTLGNALGSSLWIGFSFITIGLLSGAVFVLGNPTVSNFSVKAKITWAILVWVWYLTILVLKHILSYRNQKIARMSLVGFALLAVSWFGLVFTHTGVTQ